VALCSIAVSLAGGVLVGRGQGTLVLAALAAVGAGLLVAVRPAAAALGLLAALPFLVYPPATAGAYSIFAGLPVALLVAIAIGARLHVGAGAAGRPTWSAAQPRIPFAAYLAVGIVSSLGAVDPRAGHDPDDLHRGLRGAGGRAGARTNPGALTVRAVVVAVVAGATLAAVGITVQFAMQVPVGREAVIEWLGSVNGLFAGQRAASTDVTNWYVPGIGLVRGVFPFMAAPSAGQYMMLGLLGALWLAHRPGRGRRLPRSALVAAIALLATGLVLTVSRQSWVGFIAGVLVMSAARRRWRTTVVLLAGLLAASFVTIPGASNSFYHQFTAAADLQDTSSAERVDLWRDAVTRITEHPFLGVGPGNYNVGRSGTNDVYYAHNLLLDTAVELGLLGMTALVVLLAALVQTAWRRSPTLGLPLLVAYVVANLFDDVLYFPRNGFLLAAIVAVIAAGDRVPAQRLRQRPPANVLTRLPGPPVTTDGLR
jgi:hypothetical protein